ncbi:MAG: metal-dependent hydrolase [Nanoarchaeota archaeon]
MPTAVTHVLLTIISVDIYRDYFYKHKDLISLKMLLWAGIIGLMPDIDIPIYWLLNNVLKLSVPWFHRAFSHTFLIPLLLVILAFVFREKHRTSIMFAIASFAWTGHLLLDMIFAGYAPIFWPFSKVEIGLDLLTRIGWPALQEGIDAVLLIAWLWHEEWKHKISDFI